MAIPCPEPAEPLRLVLLSPREIIHWLKVFNEDYGWGKHSLGRALGYTKNPQARVNNLIKGQWTPIGIERRRLSINIRRILDGELVLKPKKTCGGTFMMEARAENPVPLYGKEMRQKAPWKVELRGGKPALRIS